MNTKQVLTPDNKRRWIIELSEEQLHIIASCVEDVHRFIAGQCELNNTLFYLSSESRKEIRKRLTPLNEFTGDYDWAGNCCDNPDQKRFIAQTYGIYREILHQMTIRRSLDSVNVYMSSTLTCSMSVPLLTVKPIEDGND